jgi:DNA polymerase type B, organellar and viral
MSRCYEKKRRERQNQTRPFVAIDSEGGAHGESYVHDEKTFQPHKSFLWGASEADGNVDWLYSPTPLGTVQIIEWLLKIGQKHKNSIFISFSFGYDVAQLCVDLPYEKAWEVQHGKRYGDKDNTDVRPNSRRIVYWRNYGIQYLKGKALSLWSFDGSDLRRSTATKRIRIFDVFGFFQASFLKSIRSMPNVASKSEYEIIEKGKSERGEFYHSNLTEIKNYTRHELIVLCRMMSQLRQAMASQNMHPIAWYGAGSIAQALMKRENIRPHLGDVRATDINEAQRMAHYAFFGGRIELIKQGCTHDRLYGADLSSAYPAAATEVSSMAGGVFVVKKSSSNLKQFDSLSLVKLRASFAPGMPFYPLPYRTPIGSIVFPRETYGIYMVEEALAAIDFAEKFGGSIDIETVWKFEPANDIKPFAFLKEMFDFRASLSREDITQIVIKLGMNAIYGKLAQSIGSFGKTPALASPWIAAYITAHTRALLLRAAMRKPDAIVMLATDGIVSTESLHLPTPAAKTLGAWECAELPQGGVFVQSGVYTISTDDGSWITKSRGFRPSNVDGGISEFLRTVIPAEWKRGSESFAFPYQNYMTLGASTVSPKTWPRIGQWVRGVRELDLSRAGTKRDVLLYAAERRKRSRQLMPTFPSDHRNLLIDGDLPLSAPHVSEWLDADFGFRQTDETEQEVLMSGLS